MSRWCRLILLALSVSSMTGFAGCSTLYRAPVVEAAPIVRVPPPRPEPLPRPDLKVQILVPSTRDAVLTGDYTLVVMTWDDFISLAQWFESLRDYIIENDAVLDYWENGNPSRVQP